MTTRLSGNCLKILTGENGQVTGYSRGCHFFVFGGIWLKIGMQDQNMILLHNIFEKCEIFIFKYILGLFFGRKMKKTDFQNIGHVGCLKQGNLRFYIYFSTHSE